MVRKVHPSWRVHPHVDAHRQQWQTVEPGRPRGDVGRARRVQQQLGFEAKPTLRTANLLGTVYVRLGRFDDAETLLSNGCFCVAEGANMPTSPEAIERDAERDRALAAKGYEVLRIPAKVTLYKPEDAIKRVRQARSSWLACKAKARASRAQGSDGMIAGHKSQTHRPKFGISDIAATVENGLDSFTAGMNSISTELRQLNERAEKWAEEDRKRVAQEAEGKRKRLQAELDADPEARKIHDALISKMELRKMERERR